MYSMQRPICSFRKSASRQHRIVAHLSVIMYVQYGGRQRNVSSILLSATFGYQKKKPQNAWACISSCVGFRDRTPKDQANSMRSRSLDFLTPVLEELGKPQQRLLWLVDCQIFHSLQQMRRDILIEELSCRTSVSNRLVRFDCYWRRRN